MQEVFQVTSKVQILIRIKGKDEGLTQEISSIKTKEDHPIDLRIKGLAYTRGPPSWKRRSSVHASFHVQP